VKIRVPASAVSFSPDEGRRVTTLEVAVFAGERGRQIGQVQRRVELRLTPENFAAVERNGLEFTVSAPVPSGRPTHLKAVIYDHAADRLGSTVFSVR
jgi:hypothetical protein